MARKTSRMRSEGAHQWGQAAGLAGRSEKGVRAGGAQSFGGQPPAQTAEPVHNGQLCAAALFQCSTTPNRTETASGPLKGHPVTGPSGKLRIRAEAYRLQMGFGPNKVF